MGNRCSQKIHEILPYLYLGDCDTASNPNQLKKLGITGIIDLSGEKYHKDEKNIEYLTIIIHDEPNENISQYFAKTNYFIERHRFLKGKVFVHCLMGVSRSSSIVIAYLMHTFDLSFQEAFDFVQSIRKCVKPNKGFLKQLRNL